MFNNKNILLIGVFWKNYAETILAIALAPTLAHKVIGARSAEKGKDIGIGFEYNSLNNTQSLTNEQFLEMEGNF